VRNGPCNIRTLLFLFTLGIRASIDASLQNLILALEFIFELILELPHFVRGCLSDRPLSGLESGVLLFRSVGGSLRHGD
jgi:hypothetical protein